MSLTGHLRDPGSPVRAYLDGISPSLADTEGRSAKARDMAQALGLVELARSRTVVPRLPGIDAARAGTAVDFRARIALGGFDPRDSAAALGIAELPLFEDEVENGPHRVRVLAEAYEVAKRILESPLDESELDRAALLLAHCEQVHRGGRTVLGGPLGTALDRADDGPSFALAIDAPSLADLRALMEVNGRQVDTWRARVAAGERFEPNPIFSGSPLVGGADADWLMGDVLFESKAYESLTLPTLRGFLRQLLGYVMLDLDDALGIRRVGLWLPRQRLTRVWSLERLLGGQPETQLQKLREGFQSTTSGQQLATREFATEQRKQQVLAENKHTPRWMLSDLSLSDDVTIRFRVGRNSETPEEALRELALDRYASAREGVARNESAPLDVLQALSSDSSIKVRRAAVANPRTPKVHAKSLARGRSAQAQPALEAQTVRNAAPHPTGVSSAVRVARPRDDASLDSRWFSEFLYIARGRPPWGQDSRIPIPKASLRWAWIEERSLDIPDWMEIGLPDAVRHDLMREGRPAWVRRAIASDLPISDPAVRNRLLADPDPEIRWLALQRTVDAPDDALGGLLEELAADRKERIRFRTEGDDQPSWTRDRSPAECDRETMQLVAAHPSTPVAVLQGLMGAKSPHVLAALAENPSLSADDLGSILPRVRSSELRERLASSAGISDIAAKLFVDDRDARVRTALARNEVAPTAILTQLAEDRAPLVRLAVLINPNSPAGLAASIAELLVRTRADEELLEVLRALDQRDDVVLPAELLEEALERLSKSRVRHPDMRLVAARDGRTGVRTLKRLAQSADGSVRRDVARNSRTPSEVLKSLASNPDPGVRAAVASNETLDIDLLFTLSSDYDPGVRASAARSPRLAPSRLRELLQDDEQEVRSAAFLNEETNRDDKARAEAEWDRAWRAAAPSRTDLEEMVASRYAQVRMRPAFDPRTPPDVLAILGGERRSAQVRRAVAANPNTPPAALASLADDKDEEVRQAVAFNGSTLPEVLAELAGSRIDLALIVALNPDAPADVLDDLADDTNPLVRHVAAGARSTRAALDVSDSGQARAAIGERA